MRTFAIPDDVEGWRDGGLFPSKNKQSIPLFLKINLILTFFIRS